MYKISTLNKISPVGLSRFNEEYIITEKMEEADGILVRSQDMHWRIRKGRETGLFCLTVGLCPV